MRLCWYTILTVCLLCYKGVDAQIRVNATLNNVEYNVSAQNISSGVASSSGGTVLTIEEMAFVKSRNCPAGYYCPKKSTYPIECPAGTYRNVIGGNSLSDCFTCPAGRYCPLATVTPNVCPAGTYQPTVGGGVALSSCIICPSASYCVAGSILPTICQAGTYAQLVGGQDAEDCLACPAGYYCGSNTSVPKACPQGTFNGFTGHDAVADCSVCPTGTYCVAGSSVPVSCPAGTYQNKTGGGWSSSNCTDCPPGAYCGVRSAVPNLCWAGTYRSGPRGAASSDCLQCPIGTYSLVLGKTTPCELCSANDYCPSPTTKGACPANTGSDPGSYSQFDCKCNAGFVCSYYKKVDVAVSLNVSIFDWQNNVNNVQTNFINALAKAGGVAPSDVLLNGAVPRNRRTGDISVEVKATVRGTVHLNGLEDQLVLLHVDARRESVEVVETALSVRRRGVRDLKSVDTVLDTVVDFIEKSGLVDGVDGGNNKTEVEGLLEVYGGAEKKNVTKPVTKPGKPVTTPVKSDKPPKKDKPPGKPVTPEKPERPIKKQGDILFSVGHDGIY